MEILPVLILALHNFFTAIWIGGMFILALSILPSLKKTIKEKNELKIVSTQIKQRLSKLTFLSIVVLLITGILLSIRTPLYHGPLGYSNEYTLVLNLKHIIYGLMILIAFFRGYVMEKLTLNHRRYSQLSIVLLLTNLVFGFLTILLSSYLSLLVKVA